MAQRRSGHAASPRVVMASATGGLVALASAGTALLVLTGTSAVAPQYAAAPPLPAERPSAARPGAVVVPTPAPIGGATTAAGRSNRVVRFFPVSARQSVVSLPPRVVLRPVVSVVPAVPVGVARPAPVRSADPVVGPLPTLRRSGSEVTETSSPGHRRAGHARPAHTAGSHGPERATKAKATGKAKANGKANGKAKAETKQAKKKAASYRGKADRADERG